MGVGVDRVRECGEYDEDFNEFVSVGANVLRQEVINSKSTKTNTSCLFKLYFNCTQVRLLLSKTCTEIYSNF